LLKTISIFGNKLTKALKWLKWPKNGLNSLKMAKWLHNSFKIASKWVK
jgi:hypothetical protein